MKTGKITSLSDGPKRDIEVRISPTELFSAISDPPGSIAGSEVVGCDVVETRRWFRPALCRLYLLLTGRRRVLFYAGEGQFDVALLLDEIQASFRHVRHT